MTRRRSTPCAAVLAGLLAAACHRRPPLASCDDDLRGVYVAGSDGSERWMILDNGARLEAYPLFPDVDGPRELEIHPRRIDLTRTPAAPAAAATLAGTVHRIYLRRADICEAQVPVHVSRCAGDTLELVLTDPAPPLGFAPCTWPGPAPSRRVRWHRE
ncbi:MAG TPA: hypothetical protein VHT91_00050 [Kofleriaceae bacterium]|jgi:hypothetical protein|nr:hypothetical protein [Kofleriaceae bacterium]